MPLIVKPISATLTTDKDFLGKAVTININLGSLLRDYDRWGKTTISNMQWRRKESIMD